MPDISSNVGYAPSHLAAGYVKCARLKSHGRLNDRTAGWMPVIVRVQRKSITIPDSIGSRTQAMAHRLIHKLMGVLSPGCVPVFSSDGLNLYFYGLTAHCGEWREQASQRKPQWVVKAELVYGQIVKRYRRRRVVRVEQRMRWGKLEELKARLMALGLSGKLNTAFVERLNLTLRQGVALLNRRTWGVAQTREGLKVYVEWWRGYYHFIRPHTSLRVALARPIARKGRQIPKRYLSRTPAMAAGVTDHRWTVREFLSYPLPEVAR